MSAGATTLARRAPTLAPYVSSPVARASMACPPDAKREGRFHEAVLRSLAPALAEIPVTSYRFERPAPSVPERRRSDDAIRGYRELLRESPLRPWFRGALREAAGAGDTASIPLLSRGRLVNGIALHSLWTRRYRERLRSASPRGLLRRA